MAFTRLGVEKKVFYWIGICMGSNGDYTLYPSIHTDCNDYKYDLNGFHSCKHSLYLKILTVMSPGDPIISRFNNLVPGVFCLWLLQKSKKFGIKLPVFYF